MFTCKQKKSKTFQPLYLFAMSSNKNILTVRKREVTAKIYKNSYDRKITKNDSRIKL